MVRVLGRATLRFAGLTVVAITFAFLLEWLMLRLPPDPGRILEHYLGYWTDLLEPSVAARIESALPWSIAVIGTASIIAFGVGTLLGAWIARPGRALAGRVLSLPVMLLATVPAFLIGMILVAIFAQRLRLLPPALAFSPTQTWRDPMAVMLDLLSHAVLPVATIALSGIGVFALAMRGATVMTVSADHVFFADALGLPERRVFWAHEVRPALGPQLTSLGISLGLVIASAMLVEAILSYPGLGWMLYIAVTGRDLPMMRGIMFVLVVAIALATTLVDLVLPRLDPRLRER